jgi:hypothetical protein
MRPPAAALEDGRGPPDLAEQLRHIVGIELRITRLVGKRKLNQHHAAPDREGAIAGLQAQGSTRWPGPCRRPNRGNLEAPLLKPRSGDWACTAQPRAIDRHGAGMSRRLDSRLETAWFVIIIKKDN